VQFQCEFSCATITETMKDDAKGFYNNSIFWVEVERIKPNPYQPRKEFDEARLRDLSDSIRQYGVLQPLVVTRHEEQREDGGLSVFYELIAGERRLRASKLAGLSQVPVIIRNGEETGKVKLELAIIENLQREDLNPIDRAQAFSRLVEEFGYKHTEIAKKVGKSREYVSNTLRLLLMPEYMQQALSEGKITEGHTRPLLMLVDKPEEQNTLFKEVIYKRLTVRETEGIARRIAIDRVRNKKGINPQMIEIERELTETLGTRVHIEQSDVGGKVMIDYFSPEDLRSIIDHLQKTKGESSEKFLDRFIEQVDIAESKSAEIDASLLAAKENVQETVETPASELRGDSLETKEDTALLVASEAVPGEEATPAVELLDDRSDDEKNEDEEDLYSVKNFSI